MVNPFSFAIIGHFIVIFEKILKEFQLVKLENFLSGTD